MRRVSQRAGLVVVVACAVLALPAGKVRADGPAPMPHVRTAHAAILELIRQGYRRSPTFRSLFDAVERSDLIVYVETTSLARPEVAAWLQYEATSPVNRFLRIFVRVPTSDEAVIVVVGHELQHAVEIARAPEVRDQHSLDAFYRRTGNWSGQGWDSAAARSVTRIVRDEMRAQPAVQRASGGR